MSYYTNVRYGKMLMVARFKTDRDDLQQRDHCIIRTDRGREFGEVLSPLQEVPETLPPESLWDVVRPAGPEDLKLAERVEKEGIPKALTFGREVIKKLKINMKLVDVDYLFGGERIIFYFTSEIRVDFRELVRQLSKEFRTRIELKQVGARDQARLIGDAGHCGLTLCCRGFLKDLGGINMDMAKVQKHTADPSKITGRCGKLLCCLRYEYTAYKEARKLLPNRGRRVKSKTGEGIVVDQNLLLREVTLQPEVGDRFVVKLEEIEGAPKGVAGCDGCGSPKGGTAPPKQKDRPAPKPPKPKAPPRDPFWISLGMRDDFPAGEGRKVELSEKVALAVFHVGGQISVLSNECPHAGGPLGEGKVEGSAVTCPLHNWKFDITTGKCLSVSGSHAPTYEVAMIKGEVFVKI